MRPPRLIERRIVENIEHILARGGDSAHAPDGIAIGATGIAQGSTLEALSPRAFMLTSSTRKSRRQRDGTA